MPSETVTSATSDGFVDEDSGANFDNTGTQLRLGDNDESDMNLWLVFEISARSGDTINSATIDLTAVAADSDNTNAVIRARSLASADPPADRTDYNTKKSTSLTTANVSWDVTNSVSLNEAITTPDIASVIQEVLDNNPSFDGTIEIWLFDNGSSPNSERIYHSADHATPSYHPALTVDYTASASPASSNQSPAGVVVSQIYPNLFPPHMV